MNVATAGRWQALMRRFGWSANVGSMEEFNRLESAYCQPHRHYHNGTHIDSCLSQFDRCYNELEHPKEVELALWFHDAVYRPISKQNEVNSARWAERFMRRQGADKASVKRVFDLIMATAHQSQAEGPDQTFIVDIDLSILGAKACEYDQFERAVRLEYRWVPVSLYRRARISVLNEFLNRPSIYHNEPFYSELEAAARQNLQRAIDAL